MFLCGKFFKFSVASILACASCVAAAQFKSFSGAASGMIIDFPNSFSDSIAIDPSGPHLAIANDSENFGGSIQNLSLTLEGDSKLSLFASNSLSPSTSAEALGAISSSGDILGTLSQSGYYRFHWSDYASNIDPTAGSNWSVIKSLNLKAQTITHVANSSYSQDDYIWQGYLSAGTSLEFQVQSYTNSASGTQSLLTSAGVSGKMIAPPVPEPSSALALFGGLMIFKRRRMAAPQPA